MDHINELEIEANQRILDDMKKLLDKYALKYMNTNAFMALNKCVDELVYVEQCSRLQKLKAI
ncbi:MULTISPECIES: hypothetical protein [Bacillota]|uniref:hypothetical protein n=1 Tax=Bacillota TaxID=1239 RepID=UPI002570BA10|nr:MULTISPECIES: hypothetical protein [Bacillota]